VLKHLLLALAALTCVNAAYAAPTYSFVATFEPESSSGSAAFLATFAANPTLTGSFTPGTSIDREPSPAFGRYDPPAPVYRFAAGTFGWSNGPDTAGSIIVLDGSFFDDFHADARLSGSSVAGDPPVSWQFILSSTDPLSSDALPLSITLDDWQIRVVLLGFGSPGGNFSALAFFRIEQVAVTLNGQVAEPSSIALLLLALAACGWFYGRRAVVIREVVKERDDNHAFFNTREEATPYAKARAAMDDGAVVKLENWFGHTERVWEVQPQAGQQVNVAHFAR
jgi:hypothetical protein